MSVVRAEGIRGCRELAGHLGGDVDSLLADAHIAPAALAHEQSRDERD